MLNALLTSTYVISVESVSSPVIGLSREVVMTTTRAELMPSASARNKGVMHDGPKGGVRGSSNGDHPGVGDHASHSLLTVRHVRLRPEEFSFEQADWM